MSSMFCLLFLSYSPGWLPVHYIARFYTELDPNCPSLLSTGVTDVPLFHVVLSGQDFMHAGKHHSKSCRPSCLSFDLRIWPTLIVSSIPGFTLAASL